MVGSRYKLEKRPLLNSLAKTKSGAEEEDHHGSSSWSGHGRTWAEKENNPGGSLRARMLDLVRDELPLAHGGPFDFLVMGRGDEFAGRRYSSEQKKLKDSVANYLILASG